MQPYFKSRKGVNKARKEVDLVKNKAVKLMIGSLDSPFGILGNTIPRFWASPMGKGLNSYGISGRIDI